MTAKNHRLMEKGRLYAAFLDADVCRVGVLFKRWRTPDAPEAERMAEVAQRHHVAELRRLADVVPVGPARTILLNEADRIEGPQR